jgi:muramoyltetrapeptide carboxypeptidase
VAAIKPPRLRKGDLIGLVSPASTPTPPEKIEGGVRYLEAQGYRVVVGAHASREHGYLAGTDGERAADLNAMIRDSRVKAIFALRGGYGSGRLLDQVDYGTLRREPKIICGFSDITALQLAIFRKCGLVTFSGPMPAVEFREKPEPYTEENFWPLITSTRRRQLANPPDVPVRSLGSGKAEGILLGGNLALVCSMMGTKFCPSFRDAVLVLEDVDEAPYRLDRMLTQIRNAQPALAAVVFGQFTHCEPKKQPSLAADEVLRDFAERSRLPTLANLQYGHVPKKLTIPLGLRVRINADRGRIDLLDAAVS